MQKIKDSIVGWIDRMLSTMGLSSARRDSLKALRQALQDAYRDSVEQHRQHVSESAPVEAVVTDGTRQRGEGGGSDRGKFSIGNAEKEIKSPNNFDNNGKAFNFANDNLGILKISKDEYTDDFRRVQAESQRLSDEDVRQYHRSDRTDEFKRRLGSVYAGLFSARGRSRTSFWINLSHKHEDGTNVDFHFALVNGQLFHDIFEVNRRYLKNGELVDLHDNYDDAKCFISDDGLCGFAIEPNGNLVSVFSLNPSDKKGFLYAIRDFVREQGATHLDAYASKNQPLQKIYEKTLGFQTASEMEYNMEYDHDQIAANHGNPDVVFMVANEGPVEKRRFTKDQYDDAEAYQLSQIPDKRFSLIGERGASALDASTGSRRLADRDIAELMEREGKDARSIKLATGWERGKDGKWRHEEPDFEDVDFYGNLRWLDDHPEVKRYRELLHKQNRHLWSAGEPLTADESAEMERLRRDNVDVRYDEPGTKRNPDSLTLEDFVRDASLFAAYPELKDVKVRWSGDLSAGTYGEYDMGRKMIRLNRNMLKDGTAMRKALAHEVQHAIQELEGFAGGTSVEREQKRLEDARPLTKAQEKFVELVRMYDEVSDTLRPDYTLKRFLQDSVEPLTEDLIRDLMSLDERELRAEYDRLSEMERASRASSASPYDNYRRSAGEVEARNVSRRMGMSDEDRRGSLAEETEDVPRSEQIVHSGNGVSMSEGARTTENGVRFSLGDERRRPTFYSNAERAVENVKQEKASAEQW